MTDNRLYRWYTWGAKPPVVVELLECPGADYFLVEGPNGVFEVPGRYLFWDEREAWVAYLEWVDITIGYLFSFGIDSDFFVVKDLIARRLVAKTFLKEALI